MCRAGQSSLGTEVGIAKPKRSWVLKILLQLILCYSSAPGHPKGENVGTNSS